MIAVVLPLLRGVAVVVMTAIAQRVNPEPPPVINLLQEAWAYRRTAVDCGDLANMAVWSTAFDVLFDRWLDERPELGYQESK